MDNFTELNPGFFVHKDFADCFGKLGLTSIDKIFAFTKGQSLHKQNLAGFRERIKFDIENPNTTLYLKRYNNAPAKVQFKNWLNQRKRLSLSECDMEPAENLRKLGINTPRTIAFGQEWNGLFEKRSFIITEQIPDSFKLEDKLPKGKDFIKKLAEFVRKFHDTGFRHRDLYLCHIFCNSKMQFTLIDLARAFKPLFFSKKYLIKDLAELYYSAPGNEISKTDKLRFFLFYLRKSKLSFSDKIMIRQIKNKAKRMAKHSRKHNIAVPFELK
jgi:heptose I phosphotransferase